MLTAILRNAYSGRSRPRADVPYQQETVFEEKQRFIVRAVVDIDASDTDLHTDCT